MAGGGLLSEQPWSQPQQSPNSCCCVLHLNPPSTAPFLSSRLICAQAVEYYRVAYPDTFRPHEQQAEREAGQVFRVAFMARSKLRAIVNVKDVLEVRSSGHCCGRNRSCEVADRGEERGWEHPMP